MRSIRACGVYCCYRGCFFVGACKFTNEILDVKHARELFRGSVVRRELGHETRGVRRVGYFLQLDAKIFPVLRRLRHVFEKYIRVVAQRRGGISQKLRRKPDHVSIQKSEPDGRRSTITPPHIHSKIRGGDAMRCDERATGSAHQLHQFVVVGVKRRERVDVFSAESWQRGRRRYLWHAAQRHVGAVARARLVTHVRGGWAVPAAMNAPTAVRRKETIHEAHSRCTYRTDTTSSTYCTLGCTRTIILDTRALEHSSYDIKNKTAKPSLRPALTAQPRSRHTRWRSHSSARPHPPWGS